MNYALKNIKQKYQYVPKTERAVLNIRYKALQICDLFSCTSGSAISFQKEYIENARLYFASNQNTSFGMG
jgi:hypothetical protein